MSLQINIAFRDNVPAATRRRTHADAALIADGLECMTGHQVAHLRPAVSVMLARVAVRRAVERVGVAS